MCRRIHGPSIVIYTDIIGPEKNLRVRIVDIIGHRSPSHMQKRKNEKR
jgi:hypothetical protein